MAFGRAVREIRCLASAAIVAVGAATVPRSAWAEPSPEPSGSPIPYIGGTHASRLCTIVRETVAPALVGLMNSDQLIVQSQTTYDAMANTPGDAEAQTLHRIALGKTVVGLVHNLSTVEGLLSDDKRYPDPPKTDDDRLALRLRQELRATERQQNDTLDMVNGVLETDLMRKMMGMFPHTPRPPIDRKFYGLVAEAIGEHRTTIAKSEARLTTTVIQAAKACGSTTPAPSPQP